jgi:hypothetical protein
MDAVEAREEDEVTTGFISDGEGEAYLNLKRAIRIRCGDGVGRGRFNYVAEFADGSHHEFTAEEQTIDYALGTTIPAEPGSQVSVLFRGDDNTEFEITYPIIAWIITEMRHPIPTTIEGTPEETMGSNGRMFIKLPDGVNYEIATGVLHKDGKECATYWSLPNKGNGNR